MHYSVQLKKALKNSIFILLFCHFDFEAQKQKWLKCKHNVYSDIYRLFWADWYILWTQEDATRFLPSVKSFKMCSSRCSKHALSGPVQCLFLKTKLGKCFLAPEFGCPNLTKLSARNGRCWQQNVTQGRKSFITQSKLMIFWWNKKFLKAYDLLLSPEKKIELDFGHGLCWPSFCPNRVLKEQFVKDLAIFFQNYSIVT